MFLTYGLSYGLPVVRLLDGGP